VTNYRGIVRHVRYWRGNVHRWSTVYHYGGVASPSIDATACHDLLTADSKMCYGTSNADGGVYSCEIYNADTGGIPLAVYTAFDWTTPGSWVHPGGAGWASSTGDLEPQAEVALLVEYPVGLSRTGKPVTLRKWYHAVPQSLAVAGGVDIPSGIVTSLEAAALELQTTLAPYGLAMNSPAGRSPGAPVVLPHYGNHQMPRGRRRKALVTAAGRYTGPAITLPILAD
jgi:hypothetical protein